MMKKSMRVVVTGGNGFLGQHIVKLLQVKSSLDIEEIIVFDQVPFKLALGKWFICLVAVKLIVDCVILQNILELKIF